MSPPVNSCSTTHKFARGHFCVSTCFAEVFLDESGGFFWLNGVCEVLQSLRHSQQIEPNNPFTPLSAAGTPQYSSLSVKFTNSQPFYFARVVPWPLNQTALLSPEQCDNRDIFTHPGLLIKSWRQLLFPWTSRAFWVTVQFNNMFSLEWSQKSHSFNGRYK